MLAAAQSPPPPPPPPQQRFSSAHRHLALLRTADWRQSAATPLPHANGEAENKELRSRVFAGIFSYIKKRFLQSRSTRRLKDSGGKCERRVEIRRVSCALQHPPSPSLSRLSSFSASALLQDSRLSHPEFPQ